MTVGVGDNVGMALLNVEATDLSASELEPETDPSS